MKTYKNIGHSLASVVFEDGHSVFLKAGQSINTTDPVRKVNGKISLEDDEVVTEQPQQAVIEVTQLPVEVIETLKDEKVEEEKKPVKKKRRSSKNKQTDETEKSDL